MTSGLVHSQAGMQVCEHLRAFAKPAGVWVVPVVGGMSLPKQRRYARCPTCEVNGPHAPIDKDTVCWMHAPHRAPAHTARPALAPPSLLHERHAMRLSQAGAEVQPVGCRLLANKPPVVVATPGRLWELLREGEPHLATLTSLRFLVLDEADRMVQAGHFQVSATLGEGGCG